MTRKLSDIEGSLRRNLRFALMMIAILAVTLAGASMVEISSAVIASGKVSVSSAIKKVQHPAGGVISEILVADGQEVSAGDIVARLDATITRANLLIVSNSLDEMTAKRARLVAERDELAEIIFDDRLLARSHDEDVSRLMLAEQRAFALRRHARDGEKAQLRERIQQLNEQVAGLQIQSSATNDELMLVQTDLQGARKLWNQKLVHYARLNTLEREAAKLKGQVGSLDATIAQTKGRITETELQVLQVDQDFRSEVAKELSDVDASIAELTERKITAQDQLDRISIRAPQSGVVHELAIHTIGGVIAAQETLMLIVPQSDPLVVDARVSPNDVDQIYPGQRTFLKFPAFKQQTTPECEGYLDRIPPDLVADAKTGLQYYEVRIRLTDDCQALHLVPGMPVETFVQTGNRSIFSYLLKPLGDFLGSAMRAD